MNLSEKCEPVRKRLEVRFYGGLARFLKNEDNPVLA